ncbi:hypothetical protein EYR40_002168 [Pleurotus pulmonarius]|nr:hypothetical protein EYR36_001853 [Pleurotus pulmonarius]KAF4565763.1 hypothetical protein EYR36_002341 [Pleurotus pulmonarius]KAF4583677.1 hypothetical protein EYR40_002168 [Pleurotus pulmonarius]KAF4588393.1 hypothetical protein EYR38_010361 [Pleurotus pulmonarius]
MSSSSDPLTNERIQSLNRLACKLLLHTKEMVDYVEGVGLREGHNLEFLERVTRATKMTLGKLAKQSEGDEEEQVLWDDIGERVIKIANEGEATNASGGGKRKSSTGNDGASKKQKDDAVCKYAKLVMRGDSIGRNVYGEDKLGLSDLLQVMNNKIMGLRGTHREEEDAAMVRLSRGYGRFTLEEITRRLDLSTQGTVDWKQQVEWDKDVDKAADTESRIEEREKYLIRVNEALAPTNMIGIILDTMVQIKLAIDWSKKEAEWVRKYHDKMFQSRREKEIATAKGALSAGEFRKWRLGERRKYVERINKENTSRVWTMKLYLQYGSIVLLDPLWNPTEFGRGNRTAEFGSLLEYQLKKPLRKCATAEELARYPVAPMEEEGKKWIPWHYGNSKDNDYVLLELVRFMTGDDTIVTHIERFLLEHPMTIKE